MNSKMQGQDYLIWANGDVVDFHEDWITGKVIIALDGGIKGLSDWSVIPHFLLGDFDSLEEQEVKYWQKKGVVLVPLPEQSLTDLEKAILFAKQPERNGRSIEIVNFQGDRLDHSFATFLFLKKYYKPEIPLRLRTMEQIGEYLPKGSYLFEGEVGAKLGILPFPEATITTSGLQYDVKNFKIDFINQQSIGNSLRERKFNIEVVEGDVLFFRGV